MIYKCKTILEKSVLILSLATYRVDAFLANFIDGIFLLGFKGVMDVVLYHRNINLNALLISPIILHIFYMIVYIINDLIDYKRSTRIKLGLNDSIYSLRPVYLFKRSRFIVVYSISIYVIYVMLVIKLLNFQSYLVAFFIFSLLPLSVTHSICHGIARVLTFYLLRIVKYVCILVIYNTIASDCLYDITSALVMLVLVLPYLAYSTVNYSKLLPLNQKPLFYVLISLLIISAMPAILSVLPVLEQQLELVVKALIISYLLIVVPTLGIRQLLRIILGTSNPTYYHHILRLILGSILTLILVISIIYGLTFA